MKKTKKVVKKTAAKTTVKRNIIKKSAKKWVLAIDPFSEADLHPVWNLVQPLAAEIGAKVIAAYVLAPASMNWTGDFSGPWVKRYQPIAETKLIEQLPNAEIDRVVIPCKQSGTRASVKAMNAYVDKIKADCLVISTHSRTGLERFALGSFAETVILTSKVPVLVVNPAHKIPPVVRKILVPTDLTKKSERYLHAIGEYAKGIGAEIVLYHKQSDPLDPVVQQGVYSLGGGWVSMQSFVDSETEFKNKQIEKIETQLRRQHVQVSHLLDSSPGGLIPSIEKAAKESGADMVSVLTQSGSWSAVLLGSVARALVRTSEIPVLIQR